MSAPPPYLRLGQRLRDARQAIPGLSVALLAAAAGVRPATIYQYEAGRHRPRRATLHNLAAVLGVDYAELAALAEHPAPTKTDGDHPAGDAARGR